MSDMIKSASEIPAARFYVLATDAFMSGWGGSNGKPNVVILPCSSLAEAEIVAENTRNRSEMRRVRILSGKPRLNRATHTYSLFSKAEAKRWYTRGGFLRSDKE